MDLDPNERTDLSSFLARRFPQPDERAALAGAAGVPDSGGWPGVVERAYAEGRLGRLIRAALRQRPDDARLRELAALIPAPRRWPMIAAAGLVIAVGLVAVLVGGGGEPAAPSSQEAPAPVQAVPIQAVPVQAVPIQAVPIQAVPIQAVPIQAVPIQAVPDTTIAEAPPAAPAAVAEAPAAPSAPASASRTGRCAAPDGQLVGYWYAGGASPGEAGQTITLRSGATVRSDYPRPENRYNFRFPERCALVAGDRVRLSQAPIAVAGGVYWVPLLGGDLLGPEG